MFSNVLSFFLLNLVPFYRDFWREVNCKTARDIARKFEITKYR